MVPHNKYLCLVLLQFRIYLKPWEFKSASHTKFSLSLSHKVGSLLIKLRLNCGNEALISTNLTDI